MSLTVLTVIGGTGGGGWPAMRRLGEGEGVSSSSVDSTASAAWKCLIELEIHVQCTTFLCTFSNLLCISSTESSDFILFSLALVCGHFTMLSSVTLVVPEGCDPILCLSVSFSKTSYEKREVERRVTKIQKVNPAHLW